MSPDTSLALIEWANVISAEVQNLCEANGNRASVNSIANAMREVNNAKEGDDQSQPCPEPDHITDAEAVQAQAARIRDLVSENVRLTRALENILRHCVTTTGVPDKGKGRTDEQQAALDAARAALKGEQTT